MSARDRPGHHRHGAEASLRPVFPRTVQKRCLRSLAYKGGPEVRDDKGAPNPTADVLELATLVERLGNPTIDDGFRLYLSWMFEEKDLHVFNSRFLTTAGRKETLITLAMLLGRVEGRGIVSIEEARSKLRERDLYKGKAGQEWLRGADRRSLDLGYTSVNSDYLMVKAAIAVLDGGYFPLLALPRVQHQHVASFLQSTLATNAARSFGSLLRWRVDQLVQRATCVVPSSFRGLERVRARLRHGALQVMLGDVVSQGAESMTRRLLGGIERSEPVVGWAVTLADALNRELGIVRSKCGGMTAPVAMADVVGQAGGVVKLAPYLHAVAMDRGKNPRGLIPVSLGCSFLLAGALADWPSPQKYEPDFVRFSTDRLRRLLTGKCKEVVSPLVEWLNVHVLPALARATHINHGAIDKRCGPLDSLACFAKNRDSSTTGKRMCASRPLQLAEKWTDARDKHVAEACDALGLRGTSKEEQGRHAFLMDVFFDGRKLPAWFLHSGKVQCDGFTVIAEGCWVKRAGLSSLAFSHPPFNGAPAPDSAPAPNVVAAPNVVPALGWVPTVRQLLEVVTDKNNAVCLRGSAVRALNTEKAERQAGGPGSLSLTRRNQRQGGGKRDRFDSPRLIVLNRPAELHQEGTRGGLPKSMKRAENGEEHPDNLVDKTIFAIDLGEARTITGTFHGPEREGKRKTSSLELLPTGLQEITKQTQRAKAKIRDNWLYQRGAETENRLARAGNRALRILCESSHRYRQQTFLHDGRWNSLVDRTVQQIIEEAASYDTREVVVVVGDSGGKRSGVKRGSAHFGGAIVAKLHQRVKERSRFVGSRSFGRGNTRALPEFTWTRVNEAWTSQVCMSGTCRRDEAAGIGRPIRARFVGRTADGRAVHTGERSDTWADVLRTRLQSVQRRTRELQKPVSEAAPVREVPHHQAQGYRWCVQYSVRVVASEVPWTSSM